MYLFRPDLLRLDNLSAGSSLEKAESPSLNSHSLPTALHVGVEPCEMSIIHMSSSVAMVPVLLRWSYFCDPMSAASLSYLKDIHLAADFLVLWFLESLWPPLPGYFPGLIYRDCVVDTSTGDDHLNIRTIMLFSVFWSAFVCSKGSLFDEEWEPQSSVGMKSQYLECSSRLYCFGKAAAAGSPLGSMMSAAMGNSLGLQYQAWIPPYWLDLKFNQILLVITQDTHVAVASLGLSCCADHGCDS